MMTESYSPDEIIKKYYISDDGTKDGAHLPFNFRLIDDIDKNSNSDDFVKTISEWFEVLPPGKVTNWAVSQVLITNDKA